jgi:hypothetical protein
MNDVNHSPDIYNNSAESQPPLANGHDPVIPLSMFHNVQDVVPKNREIPLLKLQEFLQNQTTLYYLTKEDAPLFSPTQFNGTRCQENATESGMPSLDIDNGLAYDDVLELCRFHGVKVILYTSANHQRSKDGVVRDRFRALFPLTDRVSAGRHKETGRAIARWLLLMADEHGMRFDPVFRAPKTNHPKDKGRWEPYPDTTKIGIESLFYVPGRYEGVNNRYDDVDGEILPSEAWLQLAPSTEVPSERLQNHAGKDAFADLFDCMAEAKRQRFETAYTTDQSDRSEEWTYEEVADMVRAIPSHYAEDRDSWMAVGYALQAVLGGAGCDLFIEFSRSYSRYRGDGHIRHQYHSFKNPRRYTVATLIYYAAEGNWKNPHDTNYAAYDEWYEGQSLASEAPVDDEELHDEPSEAEAAAPEPEPDIPEGDGEEDEQIHNFFGSMGPQPKLTPEMLPPKASPFVWDESERMGSDPAALALAVIVVCSAAIHDNIKISPFEKNTRFHQSARIWGITVGPPGSNKTGAMESALSPLEKVAAKWLEEDLRALAQHEEEMEEFENAKRQQRSKRSPDQDEYEPVKPVKPVMRCLISNDFTMEGIAATLVDNTRGILLFTDEILEILCGFDAFKGNGAKKDRAAALALFDGRPRRINRVKTADKPYHIANWGSQMLGGIQPDKLAEKAAGFTTDGLLQRFHLVTIGLAGEGIDRYPNLDAVADYEGLVAELVNFNPTEPLIITLSPEAHVYRKRVEKLARAMITAPACIPSLQSYAAKIKGMFPRLLLTMHMMETYPLSFAGTTDLTVVRGETARRAYLFMTKFIIPHVVRVYEQYFRVQTAETEIVRGVIELILTHRLTMLTERDIQRKGPMAIRKNKAQRDAVIGVLRETHWLLGEADNNSRNKSQPHTKWIVNPQVHVEYAAQAERINREREMNKVLYAASAKTMDEEWGEDSWDE